MARDTVDCSHGKAFLKFVILMFYHSSKNTQMCVKIQLYLFLTRRHLRIGVMCFLSFLTFNPVSPIKTQSWNNIINCEYTAWISPLLYINHFDRTLWNVEHEKFIWRYITHLLDFLHQWHNHLGPSESHGNVWTLIWSKKDMEQEACDVCIDRGVWLWHLQLWCPDVQQMFTRWGPVEWWQPVSIHLCLDGAACCHSLDVSLKGLQLLFGRPVGNTCVPHTPVFLMLTQSCTHTNGFTATSSQHRGELTVGFLQLMEQREVTEELVWECEFSAWTFLCPPPLSASAAGRAARWDKMVRSAMIGQRGEFVTSHYSQAGTGML